MYFVQRKSDNKIVMRCDGQPVVDEKLFEIHEYKPTTEEEDQLQRNYDATWDGKKIVLEKNVIQKAEEEKEAQKQQIETIKEELTGELTVTDLKNKLLEICNLI